LRATQPLGSASFGLVVDVDKRHHARGSFPNAGLVANEQRRCRLYGSVGQARRNAFRGEAAAEDAWRLVQVCFALTKTEEQIDQNGGG